MPKHVLTKCVYRSKFPGIGQTFRGLVDDFLCILSICCSMFFKVIYLCMEKSDHCLYLFSAADLYFACQQAHLINVIVQDSFFFSYVIVLSLLLLSS